MMPSYGYPSKQFKLLCLPLSFDHAICRVIGEAGGGLMARDDSWRPTLPLRVSRKRRYYAITSLR